MKTTFLTLTIAGLALFGAPTGLRAGVIEGSQNENVAPKIVNMSRDELLAYHNDLEKKLQTKEYGHIKDSDRVAIAAAQERIRGQLSNVATLDELKEAQRLELFNEHQKIAALIESRQKDRVICKRVQLLGTHRTALECLTVAEIDKLREMAQYQMRVVQKGPDREPHGP